MLSPVEPTGRSRAHRTTWSPRSLSVPSAACSLWTLAGLVLITVGVAGCGGSGSGTLDETRVEKAIEVSIAQQRHVLSIAVCPTGVRRQAGRQFTCAATVASGRRFSFLVTEKDDKGNVRYQAAPPH
jgi:hypothetical protein